MPEIISLNAEPRARAGKGAARATRRGGRGPGVVYGDKKDPVLISLEPRSLVRALARPGFFATLVDIQLDGTTHRTLPRDIQYHPVTDTPLHADFMRVGAGAQVTVMVPVVFINHERAPGLRRVARAAPLPALGRGSALRLMISGIELHSSNRERRAHSLRGGVRICFPGQPNRLETDRSSLMRNIASAISGAMVNCRMLRATRTASVATMLSVSTSSLIGEAATRATAPPDSTPCVT